VKRVLVTGGRGFIGRHTLAPLIELGFEVHATATDEGIPEFLKELPVTWHTCDLLATGAAPELVGRIAPSHLLHTAWVTEHGDYWTSAENLSWVSATLDMLGAFARAGGHRYVNAGSCAEYSWDQEVYAEDSSPTVPATLYGRAKLAVAELALVASQELGLSVATGRIFFAYGPFENANRIIPYTCRQLLKNEQADFASGLLERDFLHVQDAASAFTALLDSDLEGPVNIASGDAISLATVVKKLGRIAGVDALINLGARPDRPGDPPKLIANIDRLRSIGWKQKISIESGLQDTFSWWKTFR